MFMAPAQREPGARSARGEAAGRDLRKTGLHPDFWYPLAQAREVRPGSMHPVNFAGAPIVLVRTEKGRCYALEDRCAHRQVPLHKGVVRGERVQCGYHCWTYDASGRCLTVPYLDAERSVPFGVRAYPVREACGLVFVFPGDAARAARVPLPQIPRRDDPRYKTRWLNRRIACHYSFMHENLMDMNHQFLHRRLMGKIRPSLLGVRRGRNWVQADYSFTRLSGRRSWGEKFILGTNRTGARARDLMTIRTDYPYQTLKYWPPHGDEVVLDLWNVYMPADRAQRTNHTIGMINIRRPPVPGLIHLLWPAICWFTAGIFREDREVVEDEQAAFDEYGADRNNEVFEPILALREVLRSGGLDLGAAPDRA